MTRLKWSYSVRDDRSGGPGAELLSVSIHLGVIPRSHITDDLPRADDLSNYKVVKAGDLVINRMRAFQGAVGLSPQDGIVSPDYLVLRPESDTEPRFLHHMFRSGWFVGEMARRLRGIGSVDQGNVRTPRINEEDLGEIEIPTLGLEAQRAIADYLDAETARIDALIAKKQQLIHLLEERRWRTFETLCHRADAPLVPLRRCLTFLTDGPFGSAFSSSDYVEDGLAVVRLGNIGFGEFNPKDMAYLPLTRWNEFRRYTVMKDDLLAAALGDPRNHAGRTCVAPDTGPMIVKGKCFLARVDRRRAIPEYLALACSSPTSAEQFGLSTQGSTRQMINLEIYRSQQVRLPSPTAQADIVTTTRQRWAGLDRAISALGDQIGLLAERRQALITAAVAGEFRVPGAP